MITIDVVIPTYDRPALLEKAVASLLAARLPDGVARRILVVDNNSPPSTGELLTRLAQAAPGVVVPLAERRQGRSAALNAGITASTAELIGIIDDDETVGPGWFEATREWMQKPGVGFIGGPVRGAWENPPPHWLPKDRPAVVGELDPGPVPLPFGPEFPGMLMGGNCVVRREVFDRVGLYATNLGRTDVGLLSGEDHDFYLRLLAAQVQGWYVPALEIYHHIPKERATRKYFRSWSFWHGVSLGRMARKEREPAAYLAGIPRYHFGKAVAGLRAMVRADAAVRFGGELNWWTLAGMLYGRHRKPPRDRS